MLVRTSPSTTQNSTEDPSCPLIRLVRPTGTRKNRTIASASARTTVPAHIPLEISCFSSSSSTGIWALAETSRALKPIAIEPPSATTPRMIGSRSTRWRRIAESSGNVLTSISPSAASSGEMPPSLSCSAVGLRTATAQLATPRIITPSSTAWPPTGASRCALRAPPGASSANAPEPLQPEPLRPEPSVPDTPAGASVRTGAAAVIAASGVVGEPAARRPDIALLGGAGLGCVQAALGDAALEALDAAAGVHQLLPARVERVAVRADLDVQRVARRARHELVAARARDVDRTVGGVDLVLHLGTV